MRVTAILQPLRVYNYLVQPCLFKFKPPLYIINTHANEAICEKIGHLYLGLVIPVVMNGWLSTGKIQTLPRTLMKPTCGYVQQCSFGTTAFPKVLSGALIDFSIINGVIIMDFSPTCSV